MISEWDHAAVSLAKEADSRCICGLQGGHETFELFEGTSRIFESSRKSSDSVPRHATSLNAWHVHFQDDRLRPPPWTAHTHLSALKL